MQLCMFITDMGLVSASQSSLSIASKHFWAASQLGGGAFENILKPSHTAVVMSSAFGHAFSLSHAWVITACIIAVLDAADRPPNGSGPNGSASGSCGWARGVGGNGSGVGRGAA